MPAEPYLMQLAARLSAGSTGWSDAFRARHRTFVLSRQQPDGGFAGREGDSDVYYTSFAARCLTVLGSVPDATRDALGGYVSRQDYEQLNAVDLLSWASTALAVQLLGGADPLALLPADWIDRVVTRLETLRRDDGGYAKSPEGAVGSTYQSFLSMLTYELLGRAVPRPNRLTQFLYDRQRNDGGFVEIGPMKHSGANPTAAAVAVLTSLGRMDDDIRNDVKRYLVQVRSSEGGFQANTRIPFADGLSTFTCVLTAQDLQLPDSFDAGLTARYVRDQLQLSTGGFRGASWDEQADVEYTFYGLGTLALLGVGESIGA
jgi:geranylgeranyl transferase type-2 subunit beta